MKKQPIIHFFLFLFFVIATHPYGADSLQTIQVKGIYRMLLHTGDLFEGVVEEKTDTSIVIESQGKPYAFNISLIKDFLLIAPPPPSTLKPSDSDSLVVTLPDLLHRKLFFREIKIILKNGTPFTGALHSVDSGTVRLNINNTIIPFTSDVISHIIGYIEKSSRQKISLSTTLGESGQGSMIFDTLIMHPNNTLDTSRSEILRGQILSETDSTVEFQHIDGTIHFVLQKKIRQVIRHSEYSYEKRIKKYAKSLLCPEDMIYVDLPPSGENQPFFKVCIDKYEHPNKPGLKPITNVSYIEAQNLCKAQGKRLCSAEEWQWACSGRERYPYPYGHNMIQEYCNRDGTTFIETSGLRKKCISKYGVYDMVGNVFEWVINYNGKPGLMGGPFSKCQTVSPGLNGNPKPQIGFRCCKGL